MLLYNDKQLYFDLIKDISVKINIKESFIEKDYLALTVLKFLVAKDPKFVFKGGTSLSVCQKVINRFSEDVDISYEDEHITVGTRRKIKQAFIDSIELASLSISNIENIRSRRVFNRYICPYIQRSGDNDQVIVEWASQTPAFPIETKEAQTIIGKYLTKIGRIDLVNKYELEPFQVKTITKERTLVDKIFAICDIT